MDGSYDMMGCWQNFTISTVLIYCLFSMAIGYLLRKALEKGV